MPSSLPTSSQNSVDSAGPADTRGWLSLLSDRIKAVDGNGELADIVEKLSASLESSLQEQQGMAEELLGVYEQLGIIFEVTQQLSSANSESDVIHLFVNSLRQTFDGRAVIVMHPRADGGWESQGSEIAVSPWVASFIDDARQRKGVVVGRPDSQGAGGCIDQAMVGAVHAGDNFVCAIVLACASGTQEFRASDMGLLESLMLYCGDVIRNQRLVGQLREMSLEMVRSLVNTIDQKDEYTSGHSLRVGFYSTLLAREVGSQDLDLDMLQWSAMLHDVGKIGIRDDVLKKAGKLNEDEMRHMKEHPVRSFEIVRQVPQLAGALDGLLYHHEHYDGSGYPKGLKGKNIPLQARVIQVADIFDALTSTRSYRKAFDWEKALAILESEAGSTVDPELQVVFDKAVRRLLTDGSHTWESLTHHAGLFLSNPANLATPTEAL